MLNRISAPALRLAGRLAGRHRARPRRRRLAVTAPGLAVITIATLAALAGCSSGSSSSGPAEGGALAPAAASAPSAAAAAGSASASAPESGAAGGVYGALSNSKGVADSGDSGGGAAQDSSARAISGDQQLVYTAQLTVRAKSVGAALSTATSIVTAAGGYVSAENTSGTGSGSGAAASQATANVTLKIPAAVYPATLAKLTGTGLGTQLSLQQQAQDVTQQVADVGSLVASDEAAITQLRALLKDAGSVGSLLVVQDQINTETSNLESMLAQQQALDHETAYATVTLALVGPKAAVKAKAKHKPVPPPGLASGLTGGWRAFRLTVDWLLAIIGAVAPFAAIVVVIAGGAWWVRRRIARGGASAAGGS